MPLPISSNVYMPNPMVGIEASQAGLRQGQQIIQGGLDAATSTLGLFDTAQKLQLRPQEFALEKQKADTAATQEDNRAKALGLREQRQDQNATTLQEYRTKTLELKTKEETFKEREFGAKLDRQGLKEYTKSRDQHEQILFDNVTNRAVMEGNFDQLLGQIGDTSTPDGQRRASAYHTWLNKNPESAKVLVQVVQDRKAKGDLSPEVERSLDNTMGAIAFSGKYSPRAGLADLTAKNLAKISGVLLDPDAKVGIYKPKNKDNTETGELALRQKFPDERGLRHLRTFSVDEVQKHESVINAAVAAHNEVHHVKEDQQLAIKKQAEMAAQKKIERDTKLGVKPTPGSQDPNAVQPTKLTPAVQPSPASTQTPVTRTGLPNNNVGEQNDAEAVAKVAPAPVEKKTTPTSRAARNRARVLAGLKAQVSSSDAADARQSGANNGLLMMR